MMGADTKNALVGVGKWCLTAEHTMARNSDSETGAGFMLLMVGISLATMNIASVVLQMRTNSRVRRLEALVYQASLAPRVVDWTDPPGVLPHSDPNADDSCDMEAAKRALANSAVKKDIDDHRDKLEKAARKAFLQKPSDSDGGSDKENVPPSECGSTTEDRPLLHADVDDDDAEYQQLTLSE